MFKRIFSLIIVIFISIISLPKAGAINADAISAKCAVVISAETGEIIFGKNEFTKHSMASTTKIMTSLLAIESGYLPNEIKINKSMVLVEGTSMGLLEGDFVSLEEIVYGMLLQSGNDAANVAAIYLGGNIENFAGIMNSRAKQIGMNNTHFVTPSGLDDDDHYSTAYDMALLGREAIKNNKFLAVCSKKSARVTYGNPPYLRTLSNHNKLLDYYQYALGIKTGFTKKSGRCLVSYAKKDGVGLIAVTLEDPNDWYDHKIMLDYGFKSVVTNTLEPSVPSQISVVGGKEKEVKVKANTVSLTTVSNGKIEEKTYIEKFLYAPISKGDIVGRTDYYYNGKFIKSATITADKDVSSNNFHVEKENKENNIFYRFFEKIKERFN